MQRFAYNTNNENVRNCEQIAIMIDFYVSWYQGDPQFQQYDADCAMLISITSVAQSWTMKRFTHQPKRLILDSGGYRFATNPEEALSPQAVLERQLAIRAELPIPTVVCALDYPILNTRQSSNQKDACITQTIAYAYEFKNHIVRRNLEKELIPMGIVQGYNEASLRFCAAELAAIGFPLYGVGSLAVRRKSIGIIKCVKAVAEVISAEKLHIFGVTGIQSIRALQKLGIRSIDSSRPAKAAMYNEIFYSKPFRRYGILESAEQTELSGKMPRHRRLLEPLPCDCPVCQVDPTQILGVGTRAFIHKRCLHNYYHLKRAIQATSVTR